MATKSSDDRAGELVIQKQLSYAEIEKIGKAFVASQMFGNDMDRTSKAITKIMAGQELGLAPFASMRAVHVIEGNATLSANTMAGMVKSSGRYDYEITKKTLTECEITFFEVKGGKRVKQGSETFDMDEARMAGLIDPECPDAPTKHNIRPISRWNKWKKQNETKDGCMCKDNWKNYPKAMLFARCMSNGVRTYCPDVFSGMLVYTPDELNARVAADGSVIDLDPETGEVQNAPEPKASTKGDDAVEGEVNQTPADETEGVDQPAPDDDPITEADIEAANAAAEEAEPEDEPEPPIEVNAEMKDATEQMYKELPIKEAYRIRFLKDVTGAITLKSLKTDKQWRDLYDRCGAILSGDEELKEEWKVEVDPEQEKLV